MSALGNRLREQAGGPIRGRADLDGDGMGDACDVDLDGDGLANAIDTCPTVPNPSNDDTDSPSL